MARIFLEPREFGDEARRLLDELDAEGRSGDAAEYRPALDVIETAITVEVVMDVPGVVAEDVQVIFARGTLLVAGRKQPPACEHRDAAFHLAERYFGRFARAVRLTGAFDASRARASLASGELRVVLPRIAERRGRDIRIAVQSR